MYLDHYEAYFKSPSKTLNRHPFMTSTWRGGSSSEASGFCTRISYLDETESVNFLSI